MYLGVCVEGFDSYGDTVSFQTAYFKGEERRIQFMWNNDLKEMIARVERCVQGKWEPYCYVRQEDISVEVDSREERRRILSEAVKNRAHATLHPDRKFSDETVSSDEKKLYVDMLFRKGKERLVPDLTMIPAGQSGGSLETITAIRLVHPMR